MAGFLNRQMKSFEGRERGFTLIEVIVVIVILSIVAGGAVLSLVRMLDRGGSEVYDTDRSTIWMAVAAFYTDVHLGPYDDGGTWRWGDVDGQAAGHYFPIASGQPSGIVGSDAVTDNGNPILYVDADGDGDYDAGEAAGDAEIGAAAIWMGLLVNRTQDSDDPGDASRRTAAPVTGEDDLYLMEFPRSCSVEYNGNVFGRGGSYTWMVGDPGMVYGAYKRGANWYAGFNGGYP